MGKAIGAGEPRLLTLSFLQHHPVYGEPCFFVHPCLTGDNMSAFTCSREDYLTIWIGLTGSCVGLSVPKEMMIPR